MPKGMGSGVMCCHVMSWHVHVYMHRCVLVFSCPTACGLPCGDLEWEKPLRLTASHVLVFHGGGGVRAPDPAHSQSHALPQGIGEAAMVAKGEKMWEDWSPQRLVVLLQNGWYHGLPCWLDLDENFQYVDIVNKTMQQLGFA